MAKNLARRERARRRVFLKRLTIGAGGVTALTAGVGGVVAIGDGFGGGVDVRVRADDRVLGDPDAPNLIVEYFSLTCGHCARFHETTFPEIKTQLVETGRARFVARHFPTDQVAMRAAAVASCMPEGRFFPFIDELFADQRAWSRSDNVVRALVERAMGAGLAESRARSCLQNQSTIDDMIARQQAAIDDFGVQATPTLIVNGEILEGAVAYARVAEHMR